MSGRGIFATRHTLATSSLIDSIFALSLSDSSQLDVVVLPFENLEIDRLDFCLFQSFLVLLMVEFVAHLVDDFHLFHQL